MAPLISPSSLRYFIGIEGVLFVIFCVASSNGVQVVTYPVPCPMKCQLPYAIEIPRLPTPQQQGEKPSPPLPVEGYYKIEPYVQPPQVHPPGAQYPIAIEIPRVTESPTPEESPQYLPQRSYGFSVYCPPVLPEPPSAVYNFGVEVVRTPPAPEQSEAPIPPRFTGLKSKVDMMLIPQCQYECQG